MKTTDLIHLSPAVQKALHADFVFLVWPGKVQHFPARQWSTSDYQQMLAEKLTGEIRFFLWENYLVATGDKELLILMPKYHQINDLVETPAPLL
ncbi:hypothetical protein [uncultured Enterococcus sp.]|uniref:hypothetical protein n=1 Tax=uncultured Enterococcus sp. TaxID=167972 RepID=UPI0025873F76|nr:hypothetical protein [uncultured Enterococcus sp.]